MFALANKCLSLVDAKIVEKSTLTEHLKNIELYTRSSFNKAALPKEAVSYLKPHNPRIKALKEKYQSLQCPATDHSLWTDKFINSHRFHLQYFRGDNAYVWQYRKMGMNAELKYLLHAYYIQKIDKLNLLRRLKEDNLFGAYTFDFNQELVISRDLLDSISEIQFLERNLRISNLTGINFLDIGAGYGRLAHRMVTSLPKMGKYFCVDAVAESTFISEFYLRFRGVNEKAEVIPLYDLEKILKHNKIDVAINIHSFSECTLSTINWWLDLLRKYKIKYLMIVPHIGDRFLSREKDGTFLDFLSSIHSKGYKLVVRDPIYLDTSLQKHISTTPLFHYLFELTS
jgi:putative sugar O-methyltransferase